MRALKYDVTVKYVKGSDVPIAQNGSVYFLIEIILMRINKARLFGCLGRSNPWQTKGVTVSP